MPSGKNWINFLYLNIAFVIYIAAVFYYSQVSEIKANWPLYRCNPMYMFLADDIEGNLAFCTKSSQSNFMNTLLHPFVIIMGYSINIMRSFMGDSHDINGIFNKIRNVFSYSLETFFGMFTNLFTEFQLINTGIKDLVTKTSTTMTSLICITDGSIKTMNSKSEGQIGKSLGKCFHPETKIKLQNGSIKYIKDIDLGDILEDGAIVESVMKIDNKREQTPLYKIKHSGLNNEDIYVTGSHLIYDASSKLFIPVQNYAKSEISKDFYSDWFSCLITNSHNIKIGSELFWDWEDHAIKLTLY
jgi:hypothetical protein